MKVWRGEGDFLTLLKADKDVRKHLSEAELKENFDLGYHLKHVDTIFKRVFGEKRLTHLVKRRSSRASTTDFQRAIFARPGILRTARQLLATTSKPIASNFALTSGEFAEATNSASSFAFTRGRQPLGPAAACQE